MQYEYLSSQQLNLAVGHALGWKTNPNHPKERGQVFHVNSKHKMRVADFNPCLNANDAMKIIKHHRISLIPIEDEFWLATGDAVTGEKISTKHGNPLRAAMITFLELAKVDADTIGNAGLPASTT